MRTCEIDYKKRRFSIKNFRAKVKAEHLGQLIDHKSIFSQTAFVIRKLDFTHIMHFY